MTFFFDNTFPPKIVGIMRILGVDALHLQQEFSADADDVDWIPKLGQKGWVLVTGDRGISRKPAERATLEQASIISVFMAKGFTSKPLFELVSLTIRWWPDIERAVGRVKQGTSLTVNPNGKIEVL